jgi:hypothetical protein
VPLIGKGGKQRGKPSQTLLRQGLVLPLWKKISAGGMRSSEISFFILAGTIALIFGFASLPRGFIAVGIVAVIAALAAMILLEE